MVEKTRHRGSQCFHRPHLEEPRWNPQF
ncbi:unnamed protein product [Tetraodon nigroviridis]|uniref:(spotted green pufferfish) hypothetical protein n=1 Tax=Tetraodon nigroviridis TaxID=99883 RepID=Q4TH53_TETNG|nr:unnamed protein product [Tetraodon nigroviridis]